jgi:MSHA biogenesis protein MshN
MSVINQMLKDLEQRSPEQRQETVPVTANQKPSTIKIILISVVILVSLNLLGFYIWDLKTQVTSSNLKLKESQKSTIINANSDLNDQTITISDLNIPNQKELNIQNDIQELETKNVSLAEIKRDQTKEFSQRKIVDKNTPTQESLLEQSASLNPVTLDEPPIKPESTATKRIPPELINTPIESKMSVSRRQLTSEELVLQKVARAEKAVKINDVTKAEQLYEEVLIIAPNHKQSRKNLAALWFGRKAYKQATNLLSQGISLDKNDAELRLLKARIHLQQGQNKSAYNTLKPQSMLKNQEYQVMLANVSQQIEQYQSAIQAYKILIGMQTYSGRWHLGLAIVYDKNSQFSLAATEYAVALTKSDLSVASAEFAQQRMQALGE